ncbi:FG-GAP-like repeat-containing protein [Tautonia plasticadhaerens]|nr:FG-GAP-like repeat-containing protein [Tautonia plasticadhaerens]
MTTATRGSSMMQRRRRWRRLGIIAGLLALAWALLIQLDTWRARDELRRAQQEIANGRLQAAHRQLTVLAARPGALDGAADYWLGICEALGGRPNAALRAFDRVPEGYAFDPLGAYLEAKANLWRGRLRDAERRLEQALARGGPGRDQVRDLLSHIYQIEVRFDDVKALHYASLAEAQDPNRDLKELSNLDLARLPYEGLKGALEKAGQLAPQDDRVWLGKARLALQRGRWDEASLWLRRCREAGADEPLWRAWLEWARGSGRPAEALEAARQLGPGQLDPGELLELRAWLHQHRGESEVETSALERWLRIEPTATRALERLAELAHRAGRPDRAAELRRRKAEVERAMEAYRDRLWSDEPLRTAADRAGLARMAEAAGRPREARALYTWSMKADPGEPSAREGLARLDRADARRSDAHPTEVDPWAETASSPSPRRDESGAEAGRGLAFTDDAEAVGLRFVYDTAETHLHQLPEPFGGGLALLDYDGDGWLDVYCAQGGPFADPSDPGSPPPGPGDRLFHNRGDGTFEDLTDPSGIGRFPRGHGHGIAVGDIDGDGHPDVFLTRWRSYALYRNCGDGTFEDVTDAWGLGGRRDWPTSAAFADLDADGDLDLYVCHYAAWDLANPQICRDPETQAYLNCNPLLAEALPDRLFRNDGGQFVDVTADSGVVDRDGRGLGVVAADLDADGRVDLFVANDSSANFLFRNLGGMRFEEIAHAAGVAGNASGLYQAGMGVAAGDLNSDGLIDLAVTNFYGESTTYYRNLDGGFFTDATAAIGLAVASRHQLGFGVAFLDANDDGRLDLVSANGHVNDLRPNYPYLMPAQLLVGGSGGLLTDVSDIAGAPWRVPRMGRGLVVGDLDNDGRQDVLIQSHNQPLAYFHNRTEGGRSLTLRLEGRGFNRDAIGARVVVVARGQHLVAWRTGGGSYQSANDPRLHFGLGNAPGGEYAEVTWPSGHVDRYVGLSGCDGYLLREGRCEPEPLVEYSAGGRKRLP